MGAGRGRQRRLWKTGTDPGERFRLDAIPSRRPRYARYRECLRGCAPDGMEFRVYSVWEYPRSGNAAKATRSIVVVDEYELFWAASVSRLERQAGGSDGPSFETPPLMYATYRSVRPGYGLPEHQGQKCVVYAVEQRHGAHGLHVPSRCGVRFVGDERDTYWIVPALELDIGPLAATDDPPRRSVARRPKPVVPTTPPRPVVNIGGGVVRLVPLPQTVSRRAELAASSLQVLAEDEPCL